MQGVNGRSHSTSNEKDVKVKPRTCIKCRKKEEEFPEDFYKSRGVRYCKPCCREYNKNRYHAKKELQGVQNNSE